MNSQTVKKFRSYKEFAEYCKTHPEGNDSVSPGGAAARLGISRQGVYDLIKRGKLRAWFVYDCEVGGCYDVPGNTASYVYVSELDLKARLKAPRNKGGRPRNQQQHAA